MPDAPAVPGLPAVPLGPVPTAMNVGQAQLVNGDTVIVVTFMTPSGAQSYFLTPDVAKQLGGNLVRLGGAGRVMLANGMNGAGLAAKP